MENNCIICGKEAEHGGYTSEVKGQTLSPLCVSCNEFCASWPETVFRENPSLFAPVFAQRVETATRLPSASNQASSLSKRYTDAYAVARVTNGFGTLIKIFGVLAGIALTIVGVSMFSQGRPGDTAFATGVVAIALGVFVGVLFYLLGVLVSAQGQILKATLDGAVNTSPLLTNEQKASIMSLPAA